MTEASRSLPESSCQSSAKRILADIVEHITNLETLGFNQIEEIAPYGEITKILFFPKGDIYGVTGVETESARIVEINNRHVTFAGYYITDAESMVSE